MRPATIIRTIKDKDHPYKLFNTTFARDKRLSFEARGIMAYLLSKPDDWQTNTTDLINQSEAGRDKVYRILKELRTYGYLERRQEHSQRGQFEQQVIYIHEIPIVPETVEPHTDLPETVEPHTENTDHTKYREVPSMESTNYIADAPADAQPKKRGRPASTPHSDHKELLRRYQEACGYPIANGAQAGRAAKQLLSAGYTVDQIIGCYYHLKKQAYWKDKPLSLTSIGNQIGAYLQSQGRATGPVVIRDMTLGVAQMAWLSAQILRFDITDPRCEPYQEVRDQGYLTPEQYSTMVAQGMPKTQPTLGAD